MQYRATRQAVCPAACMSAQRLALLVMALLGAALGVWGAELLARLLLLALSADERGAGLRIHAAVSLLVALGHVLLLALPIVLVLEQRGPLSRTRVLAFAILIAVVPLAIWELPVRGASAHTTAVSREGARLVPLIIDGQPTPAAWLRYLRHLAALAALGLVGAEVFWRVRQAGLRALGAVAAGTRKP